MLCTASSRPCTSGSLNDWSIESTAGSSERKIDCPKSPVPTELVAESQNENVLVAEGSFQELQSVQSDEAWFVTF